MAYSQNSEEIFILEHLKDKITGKFIDIGAYHPTRFSNTRSLYEKGWSGVMVEPIKKLYDNIVEHYKDEPRIKVVNAAIGGFNGEINFFECEDAVSTSDAEHKKKWANAGVPYNEIKVPQISVVDFMEEYAKDADFISLDTEATNMAIFNLIPDWVFRQISLFCIEHDNEYEAVQRRLLPFGFLTLHINGENIILGK